MKILLLFGLLFSTRFLAQAQHCPFDGATAIVIKVVNKKGKPVTSLKSPIQLVEVDNPEADSCSFSGGLLKKDFLPAKTGIMERYPGSWKSWSQRFKDCSLFSTGCYALVLSMDQSDCMIKEGNDYRYLDRKYVIRYTSSNGKDIIEIPVMNDKRYSLCTGQGSWCRIEPIKIVI